jgi:hypothetical protein
MSTVDYDIRPPLPRDLAEAIYDVLVEEAGASNDDGDRWQFTGYVCGDRDGGSWREYRFCGALGFGGKFHANAGRLYVSCYPEDATAEREVTIARANERIAALAAASVAGPAEEEGATQ